MSDSTPNRWHPFLVDNAALVAPRPLTSVEGVGDRLRTAAFAEVQAEAAFLWAAENYAGATPDAANAKTMTELCCAWRELAVEERKHRLWLTTRMNELGIAVDGRPVRDTLWLSLTSCATAREFCLYMADAEERGRRAGVRFQEQLRVQDPTTAKIFGQIAREEEAHIRLAARFFPA